MEKGRDRAMKKALIEDRIWRKIFALLPKKQKLGFF